MSRYIVVYDISDDWRRKHVADLLHRFGDRLQLSVFEVWLNRSELDELRRSVGTLMAKDDLLEIMICTT